MTSKTLSRLLPTFGLALIATATQCTSLAAADVPRLFLGGTEAIANRDSESVVRSRDVQVDVSTLVAASRNLGAHPQVEVPLFDDFTVIVQFSAMSANHDADRFTLSGTVPRVFGSRATISVSEGVIQGVVSVPPIGFFDIRPSANGLHRVTQLDETLMPGCGVGPEHHIVAANGQGGIAGDEGGEVEWPGLPGVVDVMVVYSAEALKTAGGEAGMAAMIDTMMEETSLALTKSGVNQLFVNLVHVAEIEYEESGNMNVDLFRLSQFDGNIDEIHAWREEHQADLVALLVSYPKGNPVCGIGYVMQAPSPLFKDFGFTVTRADQACSNFVFAHELGHNFGCQHDHVNAGASPGTYPYSHGHHLSGDSGNLWRTVMAYAPGFRIPNFSNPDILVDGQPTGVTPGEEFQAHNALTINQNASILASFYGASCLDGGQEIHVPEDFSTIQAAIDTAAPCDTIIVAPGTYNEDINFAGKALHLRSSAGPDSTIIDASGRSSSAVTFENGEGSTSVLDGFTITGGTGSILVGEDGSRGGGLLAFDSSPMIRNCTFVSNSAERGGGAAVIGLSTVKRYPLFIDCTFLNNFASEQGGGLYAGAGVHGTLSGCEFSGNESEAGGGAYFHAPEKEAQLHSKLQGCNFVGNGATGDSGGGAIHVEDNVKLTVAQSAFCGNAPDDINGAWQDHGGNMLVSLAPPQPIVLDADCDSATLSWPLGQVPADEVVWYWQSSCGEDTSLGFNSTMVVDAGATYYLRAYHLEADCWSNSCSSIDIAFPDSPPAPPEPEIDFLACGAAILRWPNDEQPPEGIEWFWQSEECEQETTLGSQPFLFVDSSGDWLLRAREVETNCWSDGCGSLTLSLNEAPHGDFTGDCAVGVPDLLVLLANWGPCDDAGICPADLNQDGSVGVPDLLDLLANWG